MPDNYTRKKKDSTNYFVYANQFQKNKVNFIDLNRWFYANKNNFKYEVYPKYGTHWNHYGMSVALDTILKYIEAKRNINIPDFSYDIVNYNSKLKGNDYDVGILMNLLKPIPKDLNPYPVYKYSIGSNYVKPDVLVVGDSYWWCMVGENLPKQFFKEDEYWFYNRDLVFQNNQQKDKVKELNLSVEIEKRDVVLLMATEATFYMFPYGFIDNAYKLYCNDNSKRLTEIKKNITNNATWHYKVIAKANKNKVPVDKQMQLEAEYIISDELLKPKKTLEGTIDMIKHDPKWMADIKIKAEKNKISEEEQIKKDAQWELDNSNKVIVDEEDPLAAIIAYIKSDAKWMKDIKAKAKKENISEEEQIWKDAQWKFENDNKPKEDETLESIIAYIKTDPNWMKDIKAKAKKAKISEEDQIRKDAQWKLEQNNK